jgi:hypothetical protein
MIQNTSNTNEAVHTASFASRTWAIWGGSINSLSIQTITLHQYYY